MGWKATTVTTKDRLNQSQPEPYRCSPEGIESLMPSGIFLHSPGHFHFFPQFAESIGSALTTMTHLRNDLCNMDATEVTEALVAFDITFWSNGQMVSSVRMNGLGTVIGVFLNL